MPRFFTDHIDAASGAAQIVGEDARHLSLSLRMKPGEALTVCDGRGMDYHCTISKVERERIDLTICQALPSEGEPSVRVTLFQAMCKGEKFETIVQKSVELGIDRVVPLMTARCVSRPDGRSMEKKVNRYNRVALEAAKQCGRGRVPLVDELMELEELAGELSRFERVLFFYERATARLSSIPLAGIHTMAMIVGSEGGFSPEEAQRLESLGVSSVSLGSRILRCETAPLAALAAVLYAVGEM